MFQLYLRFCVSLIVLLTFSISLYCSSLPVHFEEVEPNIEQKEKLGEKFKDFRVFSIDFSELTDTLRKMEDQIDLKFLFGRAHIFPINLVRSQLFDQNYHLRLATEDGEVVQSGSPNNAYRGFANDDVGDIVRLTIDRDFIYGYIHQGDNRWFMEPVRFFHGEERDLFVFYNAKDVIETFDNNMCATEELEKNREQMIRNIWQKRQSSESTSRAGDCYLLDYAIANDWLMYDSYNQDVTELENRNIGVVNNVQGNYEGEFDDDIEFNIVTQFISTCSTCDPWTSSNDAGTLLNSFTTWGNGGNFGVSFGNATLWTDRNFNGSTIGIAWIAGVCNTLKYNVCSDFSSNAEFIRVLTAHEIGHNFNATHDPSGSNTIMAPSVNSSNEWSTQSKNQISSYIVNRSNVSNCFDECIPPDPPVADFTQTMDFVCPGGTVYFYDQSINVPTSWNWTFPGGSPSSSTEQNPVVTYPSGGVYDVILNVSNDFGSDGLTISGAVVVDENGGYDVILYDDFENGLGNWTIDNPNGGNTWVQTQNSYMPLGNHGAGIDNFTYNNIGARDAMISEVMDFSGRMDIYVDVEYSYRRRNNTFKDSLNIYLSLDGGNTFPIKVFGDTENGSGNFATAPDLNSFFTPEEDSDWCVEGGFGNSCLELDISDYSNEENVVLKIENVTGNGNNLFINRVMVYSTCEIAVPPDPLFSANVTFGCAPLEVQFEDLSTNFPVSWDWDFPGGNPSQSTEQNPTVLYENEGVFDVTLEAENLVGPASVTVPNYIEVVDEPGSFFEYEIDGFEVIFDNLSVGGTSYSWNFGDGNTSSTENPVHEYSEEGEYTVLLTVSNFCGNVTYEETIVVVDLPTADFEVDTTIGCASFEVVFNNTSSANSDSYSWSFPGGDPVSSTAENPVVTYDNAGFFDVTLTVYNYSGSDAITKDSLIQVLGDPVSGFSVEIDGRTIITQNLSEHAQSYFWDFGDGNTTTDKEPEHTYSEDGTYDVLLVSESICGVDSFTSQIQIITPPQSGIGWDTTSACAGDSLQFYNQSSSNVDSLIWSFEGGSPETSNDENPLVYYDEPGLYSVGLTVFSAGGVDTLHLDSLIHILGAPDIDVVITQSELHIEIENLTTKADSVLWTFGDGDSSNVFSPEHQYEEDGTYTITLLAYNECDTSMWETEVEVFSIPEGEISIGGEVVGNFIACRMDTVVFEDITKAGVTERLWVFEGGSPNSVTEGMVEVVYENPGTFKVELYVSNPVGADSVVLIDFIEILPDPEIVETSISVNHLEVSFSKSIRNADGFLWDFGDGMIRSDSGGVHTYPEDGLYDLTLKVWNSCDTVRWSEEVAVGDFPQADFSVSGETRGCPPFTVEFENLSSSNVDEVLWTFEGGDPVETAEFNPVVTYMEPGVYSVVLRVENALGSNTHTREEIIVVEPLAVAEFEFDEVDDGLFEFINLSEYVDSYFWDFGDGWTSEEENPMHQYEENGIYEVVLYAENFCGMDSLAMEVDFSGTSVIDLQLDEVNVYPNPTAGVVYIDLPGYQGEIAYRVINILGQTLMDGTIGENIRKKDIDLSEYPSGTYVLLLHLNGETFSVPIQLSTF